MLYGVSLRVPGKFLENTLLSDTTEAFVMALQNRIRNIRPQTTTSRKKAHIHVPEN